MRTTLTLTLALAAAASPAHAVDQWVALESAAAPGNWVSANDPNTTSGNVVLRPWAQGWEWFLMSEVDGNGHILPGDEVVLLTWHHTFIQINFGSSPEVAMATPVVPFGWETFTVERADGGSGEVTANTRIRLRAANGATVRYLSARNGTVFGDVATPGINETFLYEPVGAPPSTWAPLGKLSAPVLYQNRGAAGFVDDDPGAGVRDWLGGQRTYNGHTGTDLGPYGRGFREMDDGGLTVVAAAHGFVVEVDDTHGDRCHETDWTNTSLGVTCPPGGAENHVAVRHDDGSVALYVHVKQHSARVALGAEVFCGEPIALVGSAGWASGPHLHFELRRPYDPDYFNRNPPPLIRDTHPNFWDESHVLDPYPLGLWGGWDAQYIPAQTCQVGANSGATSNDAETIDLSSNEGGAVFDYCDGNNACGAPYGCDNTHRLCRVPLASACHNSDECMPSLTCDTRGACRVPLGGACAGASDCVSGATCVSGACAPCACRCTLSGGAFGAWSSGPPFACVPVCQR